MELQMKADNLKKKKKNNKIDRRNNNNNNIEEEIYGINRREKQ